MTGNVRLSDVQWDSDGQTLVWLEGRPGGSVLVAAALDSCDAPRDLTTTLAVRAQVGYGGGEFTVAGGSVFFVEKSGRLYRQSLTGGPARPVTPAFGSAAAPTVSPDGRWVLFVHSYEEQDVLAVVDAEGKQWPQRLVSGHDFYMQPRWHPDGTRIAYIAWNHPQMPWDGAVLYLASLRIQAPEEGLPTVARTQVVAGSQDVATFQPEFSLDGRWLAYVCDASGWGNLHLYDLQQDVYRIVTEAEAEHGLPAWVQGMRTYGWRRDSKHLYFVRNEQGFSWLHRQSIDSSTAEPVAGLEAYTALSQPAVAPITDALAVVASASNQPDRLLVQMRDEAAPDGQYPVRILRRSRAEIIPPSELAQAQPLTWTTEGGKPVHGLLYLPPGTTHEQLALEAVPPPAIIRVHGGPTGQAIASYTQDVQFFATRGYVVLLVNYRGSFGYGRKYMEALRGTWGVADVADVVTGASYLGAQRLADPKRIVIMGGSAGGYTVLQALCRAPGTFRAGICMYGVSNMFTLTADTHKFESRYLDSLLGPLPAASDIYRDRSPIFHADAIKDPVALFQGTDDRIVPRDQSDKIVEALRRGGVPHEYHVYEGEGHGWRSSETIEHFYRTVETFLQHYVLYS
jgi:dipeptidyl aminopeptidase/acylaminoacyl peptidase